VILNRCQSKNRRLYASAIFESIGKDVVNSQSIEYRCQSKLRTLLLFASAGIKIPKTVYASPNVRETLADGGELDNTEAIIKLLVNDLNNQMVIKPDFGTHGTGVTLINNRQELETALKKTSPNLINPSGVLAQEYIPKWFFDLRIIVSKEKGKPSICQENALVRGGFRGFRTNTFLGNMVFKVKLPRKVRLDAEKSANVIGKDQEAWVLGLDAMPKVGKELEVDEDELRNKFELLTDLFNKVTQVKRMPSKRQHFKEYTEAIDHAFANYMRSEAYNYIEDVANSTLLKTADNVFFHEGNSCPEFWEQTRAVAGINLAELLLASAQSIIDR
jgi:glutathione synthase/RimK-type ligase-like ATP-grasp enzyme